jgi:hypothetical protein
MSFLRMRESRGNSYNVIFFIFGKKKMEPVFRIDLQEILL